VKKLMVAVSAAVILSGCAGKTANPVSSSKIGDSNLSCSSIKLEMGAIDQNVSRLSGESQKTGKNVALAVTGWFLIVPWFFMDFSDAEKVEVAAYKNRYLTLQQLANQKDCG
jgi:hypothetical protein